MAQTFAEVFDARITALGVTGRSVADELGVDASQVSRWRTGRDVPEDSRVDDLADFLDLSPAAVVALLHETRRTRRDRSSIAAQRSRRESGAQFEQTVASIFESHGYGIERRRRDAMDFFARSPDGKTVLAVQCKTIRPDRLDRLRDSIAAAAIFKHRPATIGERASRFVIVSDVAPTTDGHDEVFATLHALDVEIIPVDALEAALSGVLATRRLGPAKVAAEGARRPKTGVGRRTTRPRDVPPEPDQT